MSRSLSCPLLLSYAVRVVVFVAFVAVPSTARAQPTIANEVIAEINRAGAAQVIVGVELPSYSVEGAMSAPEVAAQMLAIRSTVDAVLANVPLGLVVGHRYQRIPFFSARVDGDALAALAQTPGVLTIEADLPEVGGLAESVPLVNAPAAWSAGSTGAGWKVAVLDTGVQTNHPFLAGKTVGEACYSNAGGAGGQTAVCPGGVATSTAAGSGIDCSVNGCNHGTHVAGIAVGTSASFHGVGRGAQLIAMQVFTRFDSNCGSSAAPCALSFPSDQVAALERVLVLAGAGNAGQIAAVNMSVGGGRYVDQPACDAAQSARKAAIDNLRSVGVATVVSAGNDGYTDSTSAPACISSAVSVGSTTKSDTVSPFSNRASFLALLAPGSSILSSVPGSSFSTFSGTSMSAPHVAGAWAVLKQARPGATVSQVLDALRGTGVSIDDPLSIGEGGQAIYPRINVGAARTSLLAVGAPGRPTVTSAVASGGTLTVTWTSGAGGAPASHRLDFFAGGSLVTSVNAGAATTATIGIPAGTVGSFAVSVVATNATGSSPASPLFAFTIGIGTPGAPTVTSATASGGILTVSWLAGTGATATTHRLDFFAGGAPVAAVTVGATLSAAIPIPAGTQGSFTVQVTAINGTLAGPPSAAFAFTIGPSCPLPASPSPSGGVAGGTATVSWPPVAGAVSYIVSAGTSPGGVQYLAPTNIGASTAISASGLPAGFQAWVRVIAVNACGPSAPADRLIQ